MKKYVILAAGGSGTRMNAGRNKIFLNIGGISVLKRSILLFNGLIDGMVIVCRPEDYSDITETASTCAVSFQIEYTDGGDSRQHSVLNGLHALHAESDDIVLIHDAARCLTPVSVIRDVIFSCIRYGSGIPGTAASSTMKYAGEDGLIAGTADRVSLFEIQTPQGFRYGPLLTSYMKAEDDGFTATDDASVAEYSGLPVYLVPGSRLNIKATEKEDLQIMNALAFSNEPLYRIGSGYDVHQLVENRKLILCGIEIPHRFGLLGHSDADVGLHALMDALLGAAALGDIGKHFPDTSDQYKGISSLLLLEKTMQIVNDAGYDLVNADITLVLQKPKIAGYIPAKIQKTSGVMKCSPAQISIKATTTEKLGFEGREQGISASAVCLLKNRQN